MNLPLASQDIIFTLHCLRPMLKKYWPNVRHLGCRRHVSGKVMLTFLCGFNANATEHQPGAKSAGCLIREN